MLKSSKHLSAPSVITKRAAPGERIMGRLFPNRGTGFPGGWSTDRIQQVQHMVDCTYVAIHTICMKLASVMPNMAWVTDANERMPGKTLKCCERSLLNAQGRGFGGSSHVSGRMKHDIRTPTVFESYRYGRPDDDDWTDYGGVSKKWFDQPSDRMLGGGGATAFMTIGEYRSKALSVVKPHEELEPLESKHLLRRLIEWPNDVDTHFDYRYELLMFKLLCGVAYEWVLPNSFGKPCERWVLPSHWVWPRTGGMKFVDPEHPNADHLIDYYEVRPWGGFGSAGMLRIPSDQIICHLFKNPINKLDGYAKLWAFSRWIDTEESISKSRWAQFINQARPEFWVEMGPGYVDPDDNMIARWEAKIAQKHQGEFNTHKPLFMPAGAKAQVLSFSPEEMVYENSMAQVWDMILVGFGLSRASVGLVTDMTFGSVLATLMADCERCYNTLLAQEGQVETKFLGSRFDEEWKPWSSTTGKGHGGSAGARRCRIWYDVLTPADPAQVNSDLQLDQQCNAITPNEVRVLRGRKPYGLGGDNPLVQGPGGLMPLPINVEEDGDELTDLVRQYSESMAAGKDAQKLGKVESNEDLPQQGVTDAGEGGSTTDNYDASKRTQQALTDANDGANEGGKIEEPNGKPSKQQKSRRIRLYHAGTAPSLAALRTGPAVGGKGAYFSTDRGQALAYFHSLHPDAGKPTVLEQEIEVDADGEPIDDKHWWRMSGTRYIWNKRFNLNDKSSKRLRRKGWIGVDLDGTLAHYDGYKGPTVIGDPVVEMVQRVNKWIGEGKEVRIFTARVADDPDGEARRAIEEWCKVQFGVRLQVTNVKDHEMEELWDDRAVHVETNTGKPSKRLYLNGRK